MAEKDASARLRRAVKENNLFLVRRLITRTDIRNPDPDHKRFTSLAWAAVLGHEETFEFLLANDHDEDEISKDSDNNTILMLLANQTPTTSSPYIDSHTDSGAAIRMARMYYDRYPDTLDWANADGKTALHFAAEKGNEELVRMLCDLGADFDLADNQGNTPLHYASSWGHIPIVQLLIERGCQFSARNNQGFTASDYAYSFSTRETLQDTARIQFEMNKKSRRAVYQQHTTRTDYNAPPPPPPLKPREIRQRSANRVRSGSGTSRTTTTSDSGDMESLGVSQHSQSSISASSSPSQPLGTHMQYTQRSANGSSNGAQSFSTVGSSRHAQPMNGSSALSPIATRMRERDADAMEKYLNRNRSGSNGTASTDAPRSYQSSNGLSVTSDHLPPISQLSLGGPHTPRRLRPSMSAAQLRSPRSELAPTSNENRNRSGTSPSQVRPVAAAAPPSHALTRSSSTSNSLRGPFRPAGGSVYEEPETYSETYTGPSIQYAQFPEPPLTPEDNATPTIASTTLNTATTNSRRHALHNILTKPLASLDRLENASHRRGMSASSLRG